MATLKEQLISLRACHEALEWVGDRDLTTAREECQRGDWMLWLAGRAGVDRRVLVQAACDCAETALLCMREPDLLAALFTLHVTREWCEGRADSEDVRAARSAAAAAAAYAAADAAAAAYADAAAYAAYAAYAAADAAADAADAAADDARAKALAHCADLVRARIPVSALKLES